MLRAFCKNQFDLYDKEKKRPIKNTIGTEKRCTELSQRNLTRVNTQLKKNHL